MWRTMVTPTTCYYCLFMNGRILSVDDPEAAEIPVHPNCGCSIEVVRAFRREWQQKMARTELIYSFP